MMQIDEEKKLVMAHAGITRSGIWKPPNSAPAMWKPYLPATPIRSSSMRCTAICRTTGATNSAALARLRFISNAFTRMRYCFPNGQLDMYAKEAPENAPAPLKPWFAIPGPVASEYSIAFGHWASLEGKGTPEGIYALDTGCCWGGDLTCLRWEDKTYFTQRSNRQSNLDEGEAIAS